LFPLCPGKTGLHFATAFQTIFLIKGEPPMNMLSVPNISPSESAELGPNAIIEKARELLASGAHSESLTLLLTAYTNHPDEHSVQAALIEVLATTKGYILPDAIVNRLADDALTGNHDLKALATILTIQFENNPQVNAAIDFFENHEIGSEITEVPVAALEAVVGNKLFLLICTKGIAASHEVERLVKAMRRIFLLEWTGNANAPTLLLNCCPEILVGLAGQCFNTEYIYSEGADEAAAVNQLYIGIQQKIEDIHPLDIAVLGCYKPLWAALMGNSPEALEGLMKMAETWPSWVQVVWKAQFLAPCQELFLKQNIEAYTKIEDKNSQLLARQFDAFPNPRWFSAPTHHAKEALGQALKNQLPHLALPLVEADAVSVLFAGCGTGEEIVAFASHYETGNLLAIDLSLNSLAFAQRRTQELGIQNAHFGQADILNITDWDASFDVIVCQNVLDHMESALVGLRALKQVAKQSTLFSLALHSERARKPVKKAHDLLTEHHLQPTYDGMRTFRDTVRNLPADHSVRSLAKSSQFYCASELHDLAFNTSEQCFTPAELKNLLAAAELRFLGFEVDNPQVTLLYKQCFPDDIAMTNLDNWEIIDHEYPELFIDGMQFWCALKS
jgi:ubiquinone/menaquinone biosynthesis C-methylase UbiE